MRTVTVNMPLYNGVQKLYIGVEKGASLQAAAPYTAPPVVYYGSSITQGGCASRPGSCYENIIHTKWDVDHINLGFSGNARAEDTMMEYIASLSMSVFVYDYDYNAFDSEYYAKTHYKGYLTVREKHPESIDCKPLLQRNAEAGNEKKPFCDGLVYECIAIAEDMLRTAGKIE